MTDTKTDKYAVLQSTVSTLAQMTVDSLSFSYLSTAQETLTKLNTELF